MGYRDLLCGSCGVNISFLLVPCTRPSPDQNTKMLQSQVHHGLCDLPVGSMISESLVTVIINGRLPIGYRRSNSPDNHRYSPRPPIRDKYEGSCATGTGAQTSSHHRFFPYLPRPPCPSSFTRFIIVVSISLGYFTAAHWAVAVAVQPQEAALVMEHVSARKEKDPLLQGGGFRV